ncbi:MAG: hypothetical protein JO258_13230 [Alphaproteobacteria bacterium]|nr:hypothetical protein [Alphaproteobacteria bacterium]
MTVTSRRATTRPGRLAARLALAVVVVLLVGGCGKKGSPVPPPGEPITYPRPYPRA